MTKQAKTFSVKFAEVLATRNEEQYSKDTELALNAAKRGSVAIDRVMSQPEFKELEKALLKNARIADSKQDKENFIAVKVLVKIVQALTALGQSMQAEFDPYSRCIIANLIALNGITNKTALVSLSKSIAYSELEQQQHIVKRYNCSASTAGTQASSSRMMLKHLGLCDVIKGKYNDVTTIQQNERAARLIAMFTDSVVTEESDE